MEARGAQRALVTCLLGAACLLSACGSSGGAPAAGEGEGELDFLIKIRELFPYVDKNIDGVLTCQELKYPGCEEDMARAAGAGSLEKASDGAGPEEGFSMAGFAELMKELADKNSKGRVEFAESALLFQKKGIKQEL